jgi:hypothetical protein
MWKCGKKCGNVGEELNLHTLNKQKVTSIHIK